MKKFFGFALLFLLSALPAFGQSTAGNISAAGTVCTTANACVSMTLSPAAGAATITLGGTFSGTLNFELSGDNGVTWTAAPTATSTSAGVTNFNVAGYSNIRVRGNPFASGTATVTIFAGAGSKLGTGSATGTVTAVNGTAPIVSDGSTTTPTLSCPTCTTSAAAITNNVLAKGSGGAQGLANSSVTDNGTTIAHAEPVSISGAATASVPALTSTGAAIVTGTPVPYWLINPGGGAPTWATTGTMLGIDAPGSFGGNFLDFHVTGAASTFSVDANGTIKNPGVTLSGTTGAITGNLYATGTNCSSSASPAVCAAAAAGSVAIPAGTASTLQVNTSRVTANSQVLLTIDEGLGTKLGVTCNTTVATLTQPVVTARTAGTSFTIQEPATTTTNPVCVSYLVFN